MTQPEKYFCDFCGKEISKSETGIGLPVIEKIPTDNYWFTECVNFRYYDICISCLIKSTNIRCGYDGVSPRIEDTTK